MQGRQLDITDEDDYIEGETSPIFVSRMNIFPDALSEMDFIENIRLPLDVTFSGECASDYGGPRKEFFSICLNIIQDEFMCDESDPPELNSEQPEKLANKSFYFAGLIVGKYKLHCELHVTIIGSDNILKLSGYRVRAWTKIDIGEK
jgi:hypothetical protein